MRITDSNGTFNIRNNNRIDIAQIKAENYLKSKNVYFKSIGFDSKDDKIPSSMFYSIPSFFRCMPDLMIYYSGTTYFMEVKGCRDNVKIKIDDIKNYEKWNAIMPLKIFIYSNTKNKAYSIKIDQIYNEYDNCSFSRYNDNNKLYIEIPTSRFNNYELKI